MPEWKGAHPKVPGGDVAEVDTSEAFECQKTICSDTQLKYLNVCVGYYPATKVSGETGLAPGCLVVNDKMDGRRKTYDIDSQQLMVGLDATDAIMCNPGTYILGTYLYAEKITDGDSEILVNRRYTSDHNCTSVCLDVMRKIGLSPPLSYGCWTVRKNIVFEEYRFRYCGNSPYQLDQTIRKETDE